MRVFVTCVGRCGSVSFREACRHTSNYSTGHENQCGLLEYPDNHIEVNPQMRICIVEIAEKYPDSKWVHLKRNPETCIPSLAALGHGSVMQAYRNLNPTIMPNANAEDIAERFYTAENNAITSQLNYAVPPDNQTIIHLEEVQSRWKWFWDWIGAEGNFESSLESWNIKRNTGEERGEK